ncbi:hypothetical protein BC937DRAFT_89222 [Endogone sp. FLAS-F59071]|nr:hypothetical protein BC937DRAFT_89222 [Endogone sp. FLAS-F59071]|eukprot:RUS22431.1 hypothetical protein BC937DRAFT_89222 [Endogone sp. FLAS-F59071]
MSRRPPKDHKTQAEDSRVYSVTGDIQAVVVNDVLSRLRHALQSFVDKYKGLCPKDVRQAWVDDYVDFHRCKNDPHKPTIELENLTFDVLLHVLRPYNKIAHEALIKHWNLYFKDKKSKSNTFRVDRLLNDLRLLRNDLSGHQHWEGGTTFFARDRDVVKLFSGARKLFELVGHSPNEIRDAIAFFYASSVLERDFTRDELIRRQSMTRFHTEELRNQMGDLLFAELISTYGVRTVTKPVNKLLQEWRHIVLGINDSEPSGLLSLIIPSPNEKAASSPVENSLDENAASSSVDNSSDENAALSSVDDSPDENAAPPPADNSPESTSPASPTPEACTDDDDEVDWLLLDEEEDGEDTIVYCLLDLDDWVKLECDDP